MNERPQPSAEAFQIQAMSVGGSEQPIADIDATRPEIGPHRAPAASADVEAMSAEAAVTVTPVTAMIVAMATVHAVTAMAMSAAMTTVTASRSRGDGSSGQ